MATPLSQTAQNRRKGAHLTAIERGLVLGAFSAGLTRAKIGAIAGLSWMTVDNTINQHLNRPQGDDLPRSGRPKALSPREERILIRYICRHPKWTYKTLLSELPFETNRQTVLRVLKVYGYTNWRAKKRQLLTEETARKRLIWCQKRANWTLDKWFKIIFSDECSVERGAGKKAEWAWRHTGQQFNQEMVQTRNKSKDIRVMVWGAISAEKTSDLIIMQRDMAALRQGYSAESYIQALQLGLPSILQPGKMLQQDNAPIHVANKTKAFFQQIELGILKDWPPYSPDLNPIENLW